MKLSLCTPQRRQAQQTPLFRPRRFRLATACALAITLGLMGTGSMVRADDPPPSGSVHIYLYMSGGSATDVTATYSFHDNHLFDPDGIQVGTGGANGQILNASSTVIGYLTTVGIAFR